VTLPNGVTVNYEYDNASQVTGITYKNGAAVVGTLTYTYDADGRRTSIGGSLAATALPTAVGTTNYNGENQMMQWSSANYAYDLNGNLVNDGNFTYTWNERNQLLQLLQGANSVANYQYDALGRRKQKTIGGLTTQFLYDGQNFVLEKDGTGAVSATLLAGLSLDELFARTTVATGSTSSFLVDASGTVAVELDSLANIQTTHTYEPFGRPVNAIGPGANTQRFTAREDDPGTGLYHYRARYYLQGAGRFISEDPIGPSGGMNLYEYARGNPVSITDPLGLYGTSDCGYYQVRCRESGGLYYCYLAPRVCNNSPNGPWSSCVRKCLQEFDAGYCRPDGCNSGSDPICIVNIHQMCWQECIGGGPPITYP
jgi:RHS repeat-associated protein